MAVKIQTIKDIRFYLSQELKSEYSEPDIRVLSDILIKTATGITKLHELYDGSHPVNAAAENLIIKYAAELKAGKPVQYVIGITEFYNCKIRLNDATLIPRQETEELVDLVIRENKGFTEHIIDFGTGSGCIAIALAANLPSSRVTGVDKSEKALMIAHENALNNNVNVTYVTGDILIMEPSELPHAQIVISNPPYVRHSERAGMKRNVVDFEPHTALFVSDIDPLVYYRRILELSEDVLDAGGRIYFEINEALGTEMTDLLKSFRYNDICILQDINGKQRIIKGSRHA